MTGVYIVETETYRGYTIRVIYDTCPEDPRSWDNTAIIHAYRRDLGRVGDADNTLTLTEIEYRDSLMEYVEYWEENGYIVLPLAWYGDTLYVPSDFGSGYDALERRFAAGCAMVPRKTVRDTANGDDDTRVADEIVTEELKTFNYYLTGDVYCYTVTNREGRVIDSCAGYYGWDSITEEVQGLKSWIDTLISRELVYAVG